MPKMNYFYYRHEQFMNRAYYALAGRSNMKAPDSTPAGALYPFLNMIFQYLDMIKYGNDFDLPGDTFPSS